jgi:manganese/zinc/iron transport system permease protein
MNDFLRLISLQDSNTRVVLAGTTLLGIAAAVVGAFAVLRRRSLVGDAVAHAALPGVCIAYLIVGERNNVAFMIGAFIIGVLAAAFVSFVKSVSRIKEDAAIGLTIGGFFGVGIVLSRLIQNQPEGNRAGLDSFIFGKAASMVESDVQWIIAVTGVVILVVLLLYKEFKLLCFDRDFTVASGFPAFALDLLLMGLICICTVVGLPAVGVVLMVALLVIPGVAARVWTDRLGSMLLIAAGFGGLAGFLGTVLSATLPAPSGSISRGWPTGPLIVLVAASCFIVSLLVAPKRGLIADALRRSSLRRRIALQNLLRSAFERTEGPTGTVTRWALADLPRSSPISPSTLRRAIRQGLVEEHAGSCALTPSGLDAARKVIRAHRLWELFLIEQADIASDRVDHDADQIEHILPPDVIASLEARLAELGRVRSASTSAVPDSPHALPPAPQRAGAATP